jgi:putative oxidoreductase
MAIEIATIPRCARDDREGTPKRGKKSWQEEGRFDKDEAQGGRNMSASASTNGLGPHGHSSAVSLALLLLRIAAGLVFLYHGCAILFGAFGGPGPQGFAGFMHAPVAVGYLVGLAQFAGGLAMLSGVLIRVGAVRIIVVMLGAIFLAHIQHGFDIGKGGMEYALTQLLVALALLITGGGEYSLAEMLPGGLRKL